MPPTAQRGTFFLVMQPTELKLITELCLAAEHKSAGVEILWDIYTAFQVPKSLALEYLKACKEKDDGWVIKQITGNYERRKHMT